MGLSSLTGFGAKHVTKSAKTATDQINFHFEENFNIYLSNQIMLKSMQDDLIMQFL